MILLDFRRQTTFLVIEIVAIRVYNLLCGLEGIQEMTWQITFRLIELINIIIQLTSWGELEENYLFVQAGFSSPAEGYD